MSDLISRSALINTFSNTIFFDEDSKCKALELIDNAPTVDTYTIEDIKEVQEKSLILGTKLAQRPVGEWIAVEPYNHKTFCPFCKKDTRDINYDNFCPNCGADMRKGGAEK